MWSYQRSLIHISLIKMWYLWTLNIKRSHSHLTKKMESSTLSDGLTDGNLTAPMSLYAVKGKDFIIWTYILSCIGIPGNVVTMVVLLSSRSMRRKPINQFLIHQAFIDLISLCFALFEEIIHNMEFMVQPFLCHVFVNRTGSYIAFKYVVKQFSKKHRLAVICFDSDSVGMLASLPAT